MLLVRTGSRFLFLRAYNEEQLCRFLVTRLGGKREKIEKIFEISDEKDTIVFITPQGLRNSSILDASHTLLVPKGSTLVLTEIINDNKCHLLERADLGPGILFMRTPANGQKMIQEIKKDLKAREVDFLTAINEGTSNDTIISFSTHPLSKPQRMGDILKPSLLVATPVPEVYRDLQRQSVRYITKSLERTQWHQVKINIYDINERFEIHYQRLITVLESLDAGFILGESWTRDQARILFSVHAYQVKLFTMLPPANLKQILLGLEYNARGSRIADFDLYYNKQKIEWTQVVDKSMLNRPRAGMFFRRQILESVPERIRNKLLELEMTALS